LSISGIYGSQQSVPTVDSADDNDQAERASAQEEEVVELQPWFNTQNEAPPINDQPTEPIQEQVVRQEVQEEEVAEVTSVSVEEEIPVGQDNNQHNEGANEPVTEIEQPTNEIEPEPLLIRSSSSDEEAEEEAESANLDIYAVNSVKDERPEEEEDDLYSPFEVEARKEAYLEEEATIEDVVEVTQEQPSLQVEFKGRPEGRYNFNGSNSSKKNNTVVEDKEDPPQEQVTASRNENALYLTKIFTRDDEEDFTKMKLCIAQNGDSLESICERYEVSAQSVIKVNQLNDDTSIYEGQLLYIPSK